MINNKTIVIKKENTFDKPWALFQAYNFPVIKNAEQVPVSLYNSDSISNKSVISKITYADEINLILCEKCLSLKILNELQWVNKYIRLNIIAKDKTIIDQYSCLKFDNITILNDVNFNYIAIHGKDEGHYIISDVYLEVDNSLERVYFFNEKINIENAFLDLITDVIIIDTKGDRIYKQILDNIKAIKGRIHYLVNVSYFNKNIYDFAKSNDYNLLVSEKTKDCLIAVLKDGTIWGINKIKEDNYYKFPIFSILDYVGKTYKNSFLDTSIISEKIPKNSLYCYDGVIKELNIKDVLTIDIDQNMELMSDFVNEKFDSSITNSHNNYSLEFNYVNYIFNLIPPCIDSSYEESAIYSKIHKLMKKFDSISNFNVKEIKEECFSIIENDYGLIDFLEDVFKNNKKLNKMIREIAYSGYYSFVDDYLYECKKMNEDLINIFMKMYNDSSSTISDSRFNKINKEIEDYEKIIVQKEDLIKSGKDILANKNRVEILKNKIETLNILKDQLKERSCSVLNKDNENFLRYCNNLISNNLIELNEDSIANIIKIKEESKTKKLVAFANKYLFKLKEFLNISINILNDLKNEDIPEYYKVYEKEGQRYIAISNLNEYSSSLEIRKKYNILCLAKR